MTYAILLIALLLTVIAAVRARTIALRPVLGYRALQRTVSAAVEGGRSVHISLGSSALSGGGACFRRRFARDRQRHRPCDAGRCP